MNLPLQLQILAAWVAARDHMTEAARRLRTDERGELTGGVILLAALAVAAAIVAGVIVARLNSHASNIP